MPAQSGPDQQAGELEQLHALLASAGIGALRSSPATAGLLASPRADNQASPLRSALQALQDTEPHAVADRLRELSYLANVLMLSMRCNGAPFLAGDASDAVIATASLGLDWLQSRDRASAASALHAAPGVVRLFGIGWCLVAGLPARVVSACELAIAGEAASAKLAKRGWMRDEVQRALDDLGKGVRAQAFMDARDALTLLSLVFDPATCRALRAVLDEVPRISVRQQTASDERVEWIASVADLRRVAALLQQL